MKWIRKVAETPLETLAKVIDSLSGSSQTNAPSINAVNNALQDMSELIGGKQDEITGAGSTITTDNLTANRALISDANGKVATSGVTSTELNYLDGVTSKIQTQIDAKQDDIDLTSGRALISNSNGKPAASAVTSTELGYLDGATSNLQTQINAKQATITTLQRDVTATAANANDIYAATITFTSTADGYNSAKDLGLHSVFSDTNNIRIDSVTMETGTLSNTSITYYVLYHGTTNGATGTITFRILIAG